MERRIAVCILILALTAGVASGLTTKTIGLERDFASIVSACAWLNSNSIADDYQFLIDAGTYSGECDLTRSQGIYTITFRPPTPGAAVIVTSATQNVWRITGPCNVKIKNLIIVGSPGSANSAAVVISGVTGCCLSGDSIVATTTPNGVTGVEFFVQCKLRHTDQLPDQCPQQPIGYWRKHQELPQLCGTRVQRHCDQRRWFPQHRYQSLGSSLLLYPRRYNQGPVLPGHQHGRWRQ